MNIRQRTVLHIVVTFVALLAVMGSTTSIIFMRGFQHVENDFAHRNLARITGLLEDELERLLSTVGDWAPWDDTYEFMESADSQYIEQNLNKATLLNLQLNLMLFFHPDHTLKHGFGFDLSEEAKTPLPDDLLDLLAQEHPLLDLPDEESRQTAIVVLKNHVLLAAAHPILTSQFEGPTRGTLVFGRYLDEHAIRRIERFLRYPVTVHRFDGGSLPSDLMNVRDALVNDDPHAMVPRDRDTLTAYLLVRDAREEPALIMQIDMPREISAEGRASLLNLIAWMFIAALAFGLVVTMQIERSILSRLVNLMRDIGDIRSRHDPRMRVPVDGDDEITALSRSINDMLAALEASQDAERHTKDHLAMEKERLAVTLRSIGDGVIATDTEGRIILMNRVAEDLTGWTAEEAQGKLLPEVFHIVGESTRAPCEDPVSKVMTTGGVVGLANDTLLINREGREFVIADSGAPIRDKDSQIIGVVLAFRDITAHRRVEEERLRTNKLESVGLLAGGIAHDFNNILTAILANISLAELHSESNEDLQNLLEDAEKAAFRARSLTQQLLTFSKGGIPIRKTMHIGPLLRESAEFASRGTSTRCAYDLAPDLRPVDIDEGQIGQAINNLVINAVESMPSGGVVTLAARNTRYDPRVHKDSDADIFVEIQVKDHGIGIPKESLPNIFDPYFTTKQKGSGLGLATTHSIVTRHGGYITVQSQLGVGTTFHVFLPASESDITDIPPSDRRVLAGHGRILVMDDEIPLLKVVEKMLNKAGYSATLVRDGQEALDAYSLAMKMKQPFDAVIMDMTIPGGMGGLETIKRLRQIDAHVKAIVSSGYANDPVLGEFRAHGFAAILNKPFNIQDLAAVLAEVLHPAR